MSYFAGSKIQSDINNNTESILPSRLFATEAIEFGLYWKSFMKTALPIQPTDYFNSISTSPSKGTLYQNKNGFRYTPIAADAGTYTVTNTAKLLDVTQVTKTSTLYVTAKAQSPVSRKVLCIGDSRTAAGVFTQRLLDLSAADGNLTLSLVGTKGTGANKHEGISGKTYVYFTFDPSSPFYFSGAFNFGTYLSTNSITMSSSDMVFITLDINDLNIYVTDSTATTYISTMMSYLNTMITSIRAAVSGIRIGVVLMGVNNTLGTALDTGGYNWTNPDRLHRTLKLWEKTIIATYDNSTYQNMNVDIILASGSIDKDNDFTDHVHPNTQGYNRIGDVLFSYLKYKN